MKTIQPPELNILLVWDFHIYMFNQNILVLLLFFQQKAVALTFTTGVSRRNFLIVSNSIAASLSFPSLSGADSSPPKLFVSGKNPLGKPKDPSETKGTRKDPGFLSSLSNCKNQCQSASNSVTLEISKSKMDCLQECQDVCCKTYEQCTFAIVPRI
ncbi:hypothetical protein ScalyP_jg8229 [Parmales sp. scaly parma]|nr:hypothetical protein ScalyP_jg8229 [Parmales sp. scaly parma]